MKTLDVLLYQWVGEADDARTDSAFREYYSAAFPALVRHVQHRTGWDVASAEDMAQEALVRFFERAGRGRLEAASLIRAESTRLTAFYFGVLHSRRVRDWGSDVCAFVDSVMNCGLPIGAGGAGEEWRAAADHLSAQISPLQARGWYLVDELRRKAQWAMERKSGHLAPPVVSPLNGNAVVESNVREDDVASFAYDLARERLLPTPRVTAIEEAYPGAGQFVETAVTIIEWLPRVRVPTNGYLFDIATTTFLDEIKRQRRRKRGGTDGSDSDCGAGADDPQAPEGLAHPLDAVPDDAQARCEADEWLFEEQVSGRRSGFVTHALPLTVDPVNGYESAELLERFYEYLRGPVARAARALEEARVRGRALAQQRRFECVSRKFSRTMAVLSMMGEGYTQEEAARQVGLSRNQVKYVIENVKAAYERFAAGDSCAVRPPRLREGESHVS